MLDAQAVRCEARVPRELGVLAHLSDRVAERRPLRLLHNADGEVSQILAAERLMRRSRARRAPEARRLLAGGKKLRDARALERHRGREHRDLDLLSAAG